jgi:hypothetical protein
MDSRLARAGLLLASGLAASLIVLLWRLGGGLAGFAYGLLFLVFLVPGLPLGWYLFGRQHPAGWLTGAVLGYPISALAFWLAIATGRTSLLAFSAVWAAVTALTWAALSPRSAGRVRLPVWGRAETTGLLLVLLLVPAVVGIPFARIGSRDAQGTERYRAYFTADFLWHMALTAELERFERPFRNPYLSAEPLHYYWISFLPPAVAGARVPGLPARVGRLTINMLLTGLLFVASIYLATWTAIGRAGPATAAVALAFVAASAEGLYVAVGLWRHGEPLDAVRDLNIDAITYWVFQAFTIDGLPRGVMYNPQHSLACATGLVALTVAAACGSFLSAGTALAAGAALGLALVVSPFPGGALTLVYGLCVAVDLVVRRQHATRRASIALLGMAPIACAVAWDVLNATFEGASGDLRFGLHTRVVKAPWTALALALGPVLVPALIGVAAAWRLPRAFRPGLVGAATALALIFFVSLHSADVWVGWRAGQVLLVTVPSLVALGFATMTAGRLKPAGYLLGALLFAAGLPTTLFDAFNAQDVEQTNRGPDFPWVVGVSRPERQALDWIRDYTPPRAVVQMDPVSRGRDTWTLIPSFAERRMSAGLPISLIDMPQYRERSERVQSLFAAADVDDAWTIARSLDITYVYLGPVERRSYPQAEAMMRSRPDRFQQVFHNRASTVFRVVE